MNNRYNDLTKIPNKIYDGYVWGENDKIPKVLRGENYDFSQLGDNSYIVEALLYSKKDKISIIIRHNGEHQVAEYNLNDLPKGTELHSVEYLSHRLENVEKLGFQQLWVPIEDTNCKDINDKNMPVLTMKSLIFTGFVNNKNNDHA